MDKKRKYALLVTILRVFKLDILAVMIPRLILVGLEIAQPFMIGHMVTFLRGSSGSESESAGSTGYGLLGAFVLVFPATSVATAVYQHLGYRVMTMGSQRPHSDSVRPHDEPACGECQRVWRNVADGGRPLRTWPRLSTSPSPTSAASFLQLGLAIYLLARLIGAICIAPVIIAVSKSSTP